MAHFKQKNGELTGSYPLEFLKPAEKKALEKATNKVSLYKVFLVQHLAKAIKSGNCNVSHSYRYRPFESYLPSEQVWQKEKETLLARAGLSHWQDWHSVKKQLQDSLQTHFDTTFSRIEGGLNQHIAKRRDGKPRFATPTQPESVDTLPFDLYPTDRLIPLVEILYTVNQHCQFIKHLEH